MKSVATQIWMVLILLGLTFGSCKKEVIDPLDPSSQTPAAPNPQVGPGDGAFWGIKTISTVSQPIIGEIDTEIGTAVAVLTKDNFTTYVDAGTVKVMDSDLTKSDNNAYVYQPAFTDPTGLEYSSSYNWSIAGNSNVTAFDHTVNFSFPSVGKITSEATVTKADGYTLTCTSVSQADSVLFVVGGVVKTVAGNTTSVTFSASDLAGVSKGTSFAQVAAYTVKPSNEGGKTYYFGNETVRSLVVEVK